MSVDIDGARFFEVSFVRRRPPRDRDGEGAAEGFTPDAVPRSDRLS